MEEMKLQKKIFIRGVFECKTGLHIGGSDQAMSIGGVDNIVVRDPVTNVPYIPGSSLKGKMRSLKEKLAGITEVNSKEIVTDEAKREIIFSIFGSAAEEKNKEVGRLIVRDAFMSEESRKRLEAIETELPYTEVKTEVTIARITARANPRQMERVPAGTEFEFEYVVNVLRGDNEKDLLKEIFEAMALLQDDYLGGSGTRGYGKIKFHVQELKVKDADTYANLSPEKPCEAISVPEELR